MDKVEKITDSTIDREVSTIVGNTQAENDMRLMDNNENEHRKTPNRLGGVFENGDILDSNKHNLAELKKSVDDMVQSLERNKELEKEQQQKASEELLMNHINDRTTIKAESDREPFGSKKFNLFERLGQCMERENKTEEDLKAEVKAEVKVR